jgi:hypothetical protein
MTPQWVLIISAIDMYCTFLSLRGATVYFNGSIGLRVEYAENNIVASLSDLSGRHSGLALRMIAAAITDRQFTSRSITPNATDDTILIWPTIENVVKYQNL